MNKFTINYLYNASYKLLILLTPLVTTPYLARVLGPENLGIYSYIYSITSLLSTIGLFGLYNYGVRQIAYSNNNPDDVSQVFFDIMLIRVILFVIGAALYFGISLITNYFVYFIIYIGWFISAYFDISWLYVGLEDMKLPVLKNTVAKVSSIIGIFVFVKTKDDLWIYVLLLSLSSFMANFSLYFTLKNKFSALKKYKFNIKLVYKNLKESFMLFLPQIIITVYLQIDKIMIEMITKMNSQISFLDHSEKIINIPLAFITVLSTILMPRMAAYFKEKKPENINKLIISAGEITMMISLPMMIGIMVIADNFVLWYLGDEFSVCITALYILAPLIIVNSLCEISGNQYYTATNQIKILIIANSISLGTKLLLNLLLINIYGFIGAVISTFITSLISMIIQYIYLAKQVDIKIFKKMFIKYLSFSLLMGLGSYLCVFLMHNRILLTITQIAVGGIIYFILLLVSKNELMMKLLKNVFRR